MEEKDMNITSDMSEQTAESGVEVQEVAEPAVNEQVGQTQTTGKTEKDSYFADMRRKQELEQMRESNSQLKRQLEDAQKAFASYFEGSTLQEQMDYAAAQTRGVDVADIRAEREAADRVSSLERELEQYRQRDIEKMMADDLREIQSIDPTVTSLDDLPRTFTALRFNKDAPMSAKEAFFAVKAIQQQTKAPKPASVGSVTGTGTVENEFFTEAELDALDDKRLSNPKIMEKAMRSMARLK